MLNDCLDVISPSPLSLSPLSISLCVFCRHKEVEVQRQVGELDSLRRTVRQREEETDTAKERLEEVRSKLQESQETVQKNERSEMQALHYKFCPAQPKFSSTFARYCMVLSFKQEPVLGDICGEKAFEIVDELVTEERWWCVTGGVMRNFCRAGM